MNNTTIVPLNSELDVLSAIRSIKDSSYDNTNYAFINTVTPFTIVPQDNLLVSGELLSTYITDQLPDSTIAGLYRSSITDIWWDILSDMDNHGIVLKFIDYKVLDQFCKLYASIALANKLNADSIILTADLRYSNLMDTFVNIALKRDISSILLQCGDIAYNECAEPITDFFKELGVLFYDTFEVSVDRYEDYTLLDTSKYDSKFIDILNRNFSKFVIE